MKKLHMSLGPEPEFSMAVIGAILVLVTLSAFAILLAGRPEVICKDYGYPRSMVIDGQAYCANVLGMLRAEDAGIKSPVPWAEVNPEMVELWREQ
jgi:hypothetical protein